VETGGPYEYLHSLQAAHLSSAMAFRSVQNLQLQGTDDNDDDDEEDEDDDDDDGGGGGLLETLVRLNSMVEKSSSPIAFSRFLFMHRHDYMIRAL
jgi:hypothetical protein